MRNMLSVNFYLQRSRKNKVNQVPIIIRIKLQEQKRDISTGLRIDPDHWNSRFGAAKGKTESARQINDLITLSKNKLFKIFTQVSYAGEVHIDEIVELFHGKQHQKQPQLLELVTEHHQQIKKRVGIDYTESTLEKYSAMAVRITQYVTDNLQKKDIPLKDLDRRFIDNFFFYLKSVHRNQHNSATKTTKNLKRVLSYAAEQGYIEQSPFLSYKCGYKETVRTVLTMEELQRIEQRSFSMYRLELAKDFFLLQCYTGLAYVDLSGLKWKQVVKDNEFSHYYLMWIT